MGNKDVECEVILGAWARSMEVRNREAPGHSQRILNLTVELSKRFGVTQTELVNIRRGAYLHDVGMIVVPDEIIYKPPPFTEKEMNVIQQHPVYAYELLSHIPNLVAALDIPYCHHEKWDGSGYPRGLKGQKIPLFARIFSVVDVWDNLCSDRPYRPAWTKEGALDYISKQAGISFDPEVVKEFVKMDSVVGGLVKQV